MSRYVFDIETDGFLDVMTTIHSLVLTNIDTGDTYTCCNHEYEDRSEDRVYWLDIKSGLDLLMEADLIIGHNVIKFDIPAIKKIYSWFHVDREKVLDTLVMSRLLWADLGDRDARMIKRGKLHPAMRGLHSLESWGQRLGLWKGDYSKIMGARGMDPWASWNEEMQEYCEQDVAVNIKLLDLINSKYPEGPYWETEKSVALEHQVAHIVAEQERTGYLFDVEKANDLLRKLLEERADVESRLQSLFDPWWTPVEKVTPKKTINYKSLERHSVTKGCPYTKIKLNVFNPGSRAHIANRLKAVRGWEPKEHTAKGQPKIDDEILGELPWPEAQQIAYYLMLQKRIGQLSEGKNAWLNLVNPVTGRLHGSVNTNGAVTGRMTHSYPNMGQVPSIGKPYGRECRELFRVPDGKLQVGVDVSGLELRMLAHFMFPHDNGAYAETVVHGDIHTVNMEAAGLPERNMAKTFIYAFLYGAGNGKIGSIVGKGPKAGGELKGLFLERTPALKALMDGVSDAATKGFILGLDGRKLHIRHKHATLNTLLQSAGALVCKQWLVEVDKERSRRGWEDRVLYAANVHDEHQYEVDADIAEEWGQVSIDCIKRAGEFFNIRLELDGEAKIGLNWSECH